MKNNQRNHKIPQGDEHSNDDHTPKDFKRRYNQYRKEWEQLKRRDERRSWTPWLLIRYALTDIGLRPVPANQIAYKSPDIWIESSDLLGNAVAGEENFVHARIFNLGKADASPTRVDFYWADPSLGLGAEHMNLIGTEWMEVEAYTVQDVRCNTPWIPVFLNDGHECLKVNCSSPILDPITAPFKPREDRHVGQRNITVVESAAGATVKFSLAVNNLFSIRVNALVAYSVEHVYVDKNDLKTLPWMEIINQVAGFGDQKLNQPEYLNFLYRKGTQEFRQANRMSALMKDGKFDDAPIVHDIAERQKSSSGTCVSAKFTDHSCRVKPHNPYASLASTLLASEKLLVPTQDINPHHDTVLQQVGMEPFQHSKLELELGVPSGARPNEFIVYHLSLRTEGFLTGGYTIIIKVI